MEESFNSDYFGVENLRNLPACPDQRFAAGNCDAITYSLITGIRHSSDKGISIKTTTTNIIITGRNLKLLYYYLALYRV